jgi:anti-sigma B factor antagonist
LKEEEAASAARKMTKTGSALCVAVVEHTAFIKVPGRANYASSIDLKNLVGELRQRGFAEFILDLRECMTMDSTFLGVLAGLVLRNNHPEPEPPAIVLLNPNNRVLDLIENLGVLSMFKVKYEEVSSTLMFEPSNGAPEPTKEEVTRNCLEAHRTLMKINPANVPKFKEVTQFMAEDLKKLSNGN